MKKYTSSESSTSLPNSTIARRVLIGGPTSVTSSPVSSRSLADGRLLVGLAAFDAAARREPPCASLPAEWITTAEEENAGLLVDQHLRGTTLVHDWRQSTAQIASRGETVPCRHERGRRLPAHRTKFTRRPTERAVLRRNRIIANPGRVENRRPRMGIRPPDHNAFRVTRSRRFPGRAAKRTTRCTGWGSPHRRASILAPRSAGCTERSSP